MVVMAQTGFLVISDITGYSKYVKQSELEHARDSLTALLRLLIDHTHAPLAISKLEGDAVFSYAPAGSFLQGQTLLEMIETTYAAFRKALELMVFNTTCTCKACANLPNLDLKFFIHYGSFSTQQLGNYHELVGNDVNLIHRLTKNHVVEATGLRAYAAYTQAVIDSLNMAELTENMISHAEAFADVGEVQLYVQDMHAAWDAKKHELRLDVKPEEALVVLQYEFPIPPPLLWEYVTKPEYRAVLIGSDSSEVKNQAQGRTGVESVYYCAHGQRVSLQTIVDWQPFEQYTTNVSHPLPGVSANYTYRLEASEVGSQLIYLWGHAKGPFLWRVLSDLVMRYIFAPMAPQSVRVLRERIRQDLQEGQTAFMPSVNIPRQEIEVAALDGLTSD
jgi:hypothetical protein